LAFLKLANKISFVVEASVASGTVIRSENVSRTWTPSYAAVIEFKDKNDNKIEFVNEVSNTGLALGDIVDVLYVDEKPKQAKVNLFFHLWFGDFMILLFGLVFLSFGVHLKRKLKGKDLNELYNKSLKKDAATDRAS
jgi:hypothetical protein